MELATNRRRLLLPTICLCIAVIPGCCDSGWLGDDCDDGDDGDNGDGGFQLPVRDPEILLYATQTLDLVIVDPATGETEIVQRINVGAGTTTVGLPMAVRPSDEVIFVWGNPTEDFGSGLFRVDRCAGGTEAVTTEAGQTASFASIAFNGDQLFGTIAFADEEVPGEGLYQINTETGRTIPIRPSAPDVGALAFDQEGVRYEVPLRALENTDPLLMTKTDPEGEVTEVPLDETIDDVFGMTFDEEGTLLASGRRTVFVFRGGSREEVTNFVLLELDSVSGEILENPSGLERVTILSRALEGLGFALECEDTPQP